MSTHDDRYYLQRAPIWRALVHLCIPMMAAVSVGVVYNIINAGFIGSLHSVPQLSAITFGLPVFALLMAVGGVFGTGGGTAVSRLLGELETAGPAGPGSSGAESIRARIVRLSAFTVWGSVVAGLVVAVLGTVFLRPIVHLLGADAAAAGPTELYVGVLLAGAPVLVLAFAMEQLVRAEGATKASMIGIIASTVANLAFDVLFILVLGWGVGGAALAMVLSNLVTVGYFVWHLRRSPVIRIGIEAFRPDLVTAREVFGVGVSELLMSGFLVVSSLLLNNVAVAYGDGVLAAFGVALRIVQLPEMLCMGVFMGALPLIAVAYGARATDRLRGTILQSALWIAGIVLVFATPVFFLRGSVFELFSDSPDVTGVGVLILTAMLVSALFNGFTGLVIAMFQATGQALPATIMALTQGILLIPVLLVGHAMFGLTGVIWAMTISELLTFGIGLTLFGTYRRRLLTPTPAEAQLVAEAVPA